MDGRVIDKSFADGGSQVCFGCCAAKISAAMEMENNRVAILARFRFCCWYCQCIKLPFFVS